MENLIEVMCENVVADPTLLEQVDKYTLIELQKTLDYYLNTSRPLDIQNVEDDDYYFEEDH